MKIKLFIPLIILAACFFGNATNAKAQELDLNVCIAQFPCHLTTGRLLPGFVAGTPCNWEKVCQEYRNSSDFKKLRLKLQRERRKNLKRNNPVHHRQQR